MSKKPTSKPKESNAGILSRTKLYGFELFMSVIGLLAVAFVVDYGIFSLLRHFSHDVDSYQSSDQIVILLVAAMIVWLPVATFFYLRVRGESQASSETPEVRSHKVLVSIYMALNTVIAIGALFYTVYVLLEMVVGTNSDVVNPVMRQIIPGVLMALWHGWLLFAFTNRRATSRRIFATSYSIITVIVVVVLFAVTADSIRSQAIDQQRESDLSAIQDVINGYYEEEERLPVSLEDVEIPRLKNDVDDYSYRKVAEKRYELCASFLEDTRGVQQEYGPYAGGYTEYPVWSNHSSESYCFKIKPFSEELGIQ